VNRLGWLAISLLVVTSDCKQRGLHHSAAAVPTPSTDVISADEPDAADTAIFVPDSAPADASAARSSERAEAAPLAPDSVFEGVDTLTIPRATYRIVLPDEVPTLEVDRTLRIDDQGDRAVITVLGDGLPLLPGTRVAARNGFMGIILVSPDGMHYRVVSPDEVQHWFLGNSSRAGAALQFHRTDNTVVATRGGLSLVLTTPASGDRHPLTCRLLVAMILGGDPALARFGCSEARMPTRAMVRARGWAAIAFERTALADETLSRRTVAFPPAHASPDYAVPRHAPEGRFYTDAELATLPGRHGSRRTLRVRNGLTRESLVFLDDLALGWLAPGSSLEFGDLTDGLHHVRIRSLDGLERSRNLPANLPATFDFDLDPNLR
jgi:hypothetical protein